MIDVDDPIASGLLERYFAGACLAEERAQVETWIAGEPGRSALVDRLRQAWQMTAAVVPPLTQQDVRAAWRKTIEHTEQSISVSRPPRRPRSRTRVWMVLTATAAAAVLGVLGLWRLSTGPQTHEAREYATRPGQRLAITLIDGTHVTLAPGSRLRVPMGYGAHARETTLEGEAYFSVVHNEAHPFSVRTTDAVVRDVGTRFVVRAYGDEVGEQVAVTEGRLAVGMASTPPLFASGAMMSVGDLATITADRISVTHGANCSGLTGWLQGRLVFNAVPLAQVARDLERTFGLVIVIHDSVLTRQTVTASFDNERADEVLDVVTSVVGATYVRTGNHIVIRRPLAVERKTQPASAIPPVRTAQIAALEE